MSAAPDFNAQIRKRPMVVTPGRNGYRLALVGGTHFETLAEYPTQEEAQQARQMALTALSSPAPRIDPAPECETPEPYIGKYPACVRLALIVLLAAASWVPLILGVRFALSFFVQP